MSAPVSKILTGVVLLAAAAATTAWLMRPQPVPVDLVTLTAGPMQVTVEGDGRTRVREDYLVSAPLSGQLVRVDAHVGDRVRAEETVLAVMRPNPPAFLDQRARVAAEAQVKAAEAALALAGAELDRARAELGFARSDLARARRLSAKGSIAKRDLERAELDLRTHAAAVATAEAQKRVLASELDVARAALIDPAATAESGDDCCIEIRSPVNGRVLQIMRESAGVIAAGSPILDVGDPRDLEVVIDLPSTAVLRVRPGATVYLEDWGGGPALAGEVRRVEPFGFTKTSALGIEEQRVNVIIDFTGPREARESLGHGYQVNARIVIWQSKNVLKMPLSALFRVGADWAVFAVENGQARQRRVEIGRSNGTDAELLGGLAAGAQVVTHPSDRVVDGVAIVARTP